MIRTSAVRGDRLADPLVGLVLDQAEELRLQCQRQVADLVEEQRPAVGRIHLPDLVRDGPGERPLTCPNRSLSSNSADRLGQ